MWLRNLVLRNWRSPGVLSYCLLPLSGLYWLAVVVRRKCYQGKLLASYRAPVAVIVVGNLGVGGSGKTPLVMHLVKKLQQAGRKPGIVARGYRGTGPFPLLVRADTPPSACGDEPAMIVSRLGVPMVVGPDRPAATALLTGQFDIDVVISDDGLQHYALQRDLEIAVSDDTVGCTNRFLLPAGPWREPLSRLRNVNIQVRHVKAGAIEGDGSLPNQYLMQLLPLTPRRVDGQQADGQFNPSGKVHAVAGIGQPERFFQSCEAMGLQVQRHVFPDHYHYHADDLQFSDDQLVLMTEKDAVKCRQFATDKHWYLPVDATLSDDFTEQVLRELAAWKLTDG